VKRNLIIGLCIGGLLLALVRLLPLVFQSSAPEPVSAPVAVRHRVPSSPLPPPPPPPPPEPTPAEEPPEEIAEEVPEEAPFMPAQIDLQPPRPPEPAPAPAPEPSEAAPSPSKKAKPVGPPTLKGLFPVTLGDAFQLIAVTEGTPSKLDRHFFLDEPPRYVFDLPGDWQKLPVRQMKIFNGIVNTVRLARNGERLRIVLDLAEQGRPQGIFTPTSNGFVLDLKPAP